MAVIDRLLSPESRFQKRFFFLAKRFVAGESAAAAMDAIEALNEAGMLATLDFLGEDVSNQADALRTRDEYLGLLATIRTRGVRTNVSLKLTAMGLLIDENFAYQNVGAVVAAASHNPDPFVRIDMEGSAVLEPTLRIFERVFSDRKNIGPVLQAYLLRTPEDIERMIGLGARVRLCKGAYNEPPDIAYKEMSTIRREYLRCAESLLQRGTYPGIATHDERIISAVKTFANDHGIARESFEFQMLYGIRPDIQRALVRAGYRVRVYVPYGTHWAGYFYRRIMERKENARFVLGSLFRG